MATKLKYDHLLFIENKHFLASSIMSIENNQAGNIVLTFDGNHTIVITNDVEKENFKTQYGTFCASNGIRVWGEL